MDIDIKRDLIFKIILDKGPISRVQLADITNLNLATIGKYIEILLDMGVISAQGQTESTGGRPATLFGINPGFGPGIGISLGVNKLRCVVTNIAGELKFVLRADIENGTDVLAEVKKLIERALEEYPDVMSIGIASSGFIDYSTGVSLFSPHRKGLNNVPLKSQFEEEFSLPVFVDDLSRTSAAAEKYIGSTKEEDSFIYLYLGEGIGAGVYINGELHRGNKGIAGEIGHFVVDRNGPRCGCGNFGCLEVYSSCKAIVESVSKALDSGVISVLTKEELNIGKIIEEAKKGDKLAYKVITEAAERIGFVVAQSINLLGIELIVIGGKLKVADNMIVEPITRLIRTNALSPFSRDLEVRLSKLNDDAGAIGASILGLYGVLTKGII